MNVISSVFSFYGVAKRKEFWCVVLTVIFLRTISIPLFAKTFGVTGGIIEWLVMMLLMAPVTVRRLRDANGKIEMLVVFAVLVIFSALLSINGDWENAQILKQVSSIVGIYIMWVAGFRKSRTLG